MKLVRLYRASMYAMLTLATTVLSINAQEYSRLAMLYPLGVAAAGLVAFLTVDRHPRRGLARDLANFLAMGSFVIAMMEYWANPEALPLALGHWLVYLQILKTFLPKTFEDDWFLFLLGLVQVVIGVYLSQSHEVGLLLVAWALMSLWTLGLFHLHREAARMAPEAGVVVSPQTDVRNPYPGLFNLGFVLSTLAVAVTTLALGGLIFLIMPRWSTAASNGISSSSSKHLTGFSDEVQLGRMGEILENDSVVMTVESYDARDRKVHPPDDTLWRGVTLVIYEDGRWIRENQLPIQVDRVPFPAPASQATLAQRIKLEATEGDVLFAMRPIHGVSSRSGDEIAMNQFDGTLYRLGQRSNASFEQSSPTSAGTYDYEVWADTRRSTTTDERVLSPAHPEAQAAGGPRGDRRTTPRARRRDPRRQRGDPLAPTGTPPRSVSAVFGEVLLYAQHGAGRSDDRPGPRLPAKPPGGPLRVLRQRPHALAPCPGHSDPDGQRL